MELFHYTTAAQAFLKKDFEGVHYATVAVEAGLPMYLKKNQELILDKDKLSFIYSADGEAYGNQENTADAISAYNKSLRSCK